MAGCEPEDLLEQLDNQFGDTRVFSYQIPHMDDARKYFYRNRALPFESTALRPVLDAATRTWSPNC